MAIGSALNQLEQMASPGSVLGLERMETLLELIGHPEQGLQIIHVAGTNGKGSTCAAISSILQAAGYRVGLYTSPHLVRFNERIKISGEEISNVDLDRISHGLIKLLQDWENKGWGELPTQFELYTAIAFLYFQQAEVDFAVVEVGLGGRLDATNLVTPFVSVITPISYDHRDRLGESLEQIAREKAGIIKTDGLVVIAHQEDSVKQVINDRCQEVGATPYWLGQDANYMRDNTNNDDNCFRYRGLDLDLTHLRFALKGEHQLMNGATALMAIEVLQLRGSIVSEQAIREGLDRTDWPGRLEVVALQPRVIIDAAHNPQGAQALARALQTCFSYQRLILVLGVLEDKDIKGIVSPLLPLAELVVVTNPISERAGNVDRLSDVVKQLFDRKAVVEPDVKQALQVAFKESQRDDLICIAGSLYLIGPVKSMLKEMKTMM